MGVARLQPPQSVLGSRAFCLLAMQAYHAAKPAHYPPSQTPGGARLCDFERQGQHCHAAKIPVANSLLRRAYLLALHTVFEFESSYINVGPSIANDSLTYHTKIVATCRQKLMSDWEPVDDAQRLTEIEHRYFLPERRRRRLHGI